MKKFTRVMALLLVAVMVLSGCSKGKTEPGSANDDKGGVTQDKDKDSDKGGEKAPEVVMKDTTINIRLMNEVRNIEMIVAEYENRVKDHPILSKIHLNIEYVVGGDYKDKLSMAVNAQEDYDLMFAGAWHGLSGYASSGALKDLSSYFNNDAFPGLKAAFSEDYVNAAMTYVKNADGTYEKKLFSIPLAEALYDIRGLYYRDDLRIKYGIPEITSDEIMLEFVKAIKENEPEMIPLQMYNGFFYWETPYFTGAHDNVFAQEIVGEETPFYVALNADGTQVLNAVVMGDSQEEFNKMPEGYKTDFLKAYKLEHLKWADYLDTARGTTDTSVGFAGAVYGNVTGYPSVINDLNVNVDLLAEYPEASLRFYPTEESQRNMERGAIVSEMKSNNFLVVPEWSEKTDAVMYFLDWMYGTRENHDLFQFGIEGIHWEPIGETGYRLLEASEADKYIMPGYSFTWNPSYVRSHEAYEQDSYMKQLFDYQTSESAYSMSPISGFAFDKTALEVEMANVSALSGELLTRHALHGDNTETVINDWHKDAIRVGLEDIRAELIKQMQEFIDMKNSTK